MKTRLLIIFGIIGLISLSGFTIHAYANEPSPVGVTILNYGIFDPNENNTHELIVDQKYHIKVHFKSDLDEPVFFRYFVQVLDKDKHWTEPIREFYKNGILEPNEEKFFTFTWTPEYAGEFRTFSEISDDVQKTTIGSVPQFDFQVIQPDKLDPNFKNTEPLVPEPSPICPAGTTVKNDVCVITSTDCGLGTTYQDGMCVVDKIENSTETSPDPSNCWGGPSCNYVESPLKQLRSGIAIDEIQCRESLTLVTKHDGSPACVKESTASKLSDRGWSYTLELIEWEKENENN